MSAADAKAHAKTRLEAFGWEQSEFSSLEQLWDAESKWNYQAYNKQSGTLGIPQLKGWQNVPNYQTDYKVQIEHGLTCIKNKKKIWNTNKCMEIFSKKSLLLR
jgi:hypothetical protein